MKLKTLLFACFSLLVMACSSDEPENKPDVKPDPTPDPPQEETVITFDESEFELMVGASHVIPFTVTPSDAVVEWESSDDRIATVDQKGCVTAVARGTATVTAKSGNATATCTVKVQRAPQVGDFYFSDGTYSSSLFASKTVIGVIFWVGDPTADDAALRRDHPDCTHGLVVASHPDTNPYAWQMNYSDYGRTTGSWIEKNAPDYVSPDSEWMRDTRRNVIAGYNNTKAIEAFNAAAENKDWPVNAVQEVVKYRSSVPAPENSSDWFLPGVKELSLLINDVYDGDVLDFNDVANYLCGNNKVKINEVLSQITGYGAELIGSDSWAYDYWASTDWYYSQAYHVSSNDGTIMAGSKDGVYNQQVRCVLAF